MKEIIVDFDCSLTQSFGQFAGVLWGVEVWFKTNEVEKSFFKITRAAIPVRVTEESLWPKRQSNTFAGNLNIWCQQTGSTYKHTS